MGFPNRPPIVFAIAYGLTLTNVSSRDVVAVLELIVPQPYGGVEIIGAHVADLPKGFVTAEEQPGATQFRRAVNIPTCTAAVGYVGFKLTKRVISPGMAFEVPEMVQRPKDLQELQQLGEHEATKQLVEGAAFALGIRLRITNQLDGSHHDFSIYGERFPADDFLRRLRSVFPTQAVKPDTWIPGDPVPTPDFPIWVQLDQTPLTAFSAFRDLERPNRSNLFAVLHGLTLTNLSTETVAAFLELIVFRENGGIRAVAAEIDDIPTVKAGGDAAEPLSTLPLGIQFRRIVNLAARSSVIGHVGFRLTEEVLDGRFGTAAPYRNINALTREELINLGNLTMNAILRVTNQLDGSYRDFPVMKSVQGRAKEFESRTKPSN